jgi:uroporphyrin-III C-methyltransferase/precorrin-2 dehydrogenase/sirohydrochlorin ferrochelatase
LLTQKAVRRLAEADVVLADALVSPSLRALAPHADWITAGKRGGGEQTPQEAITRQLIDSAAAGLRVVRLKGGDPFVLGRGGEEALALAAAGIDFEVVPGVTAAISAPALAGIPVTHRGLSSGFIVLTGSNRELIDRVFASIPPGWLTIVILMGVASRASFVTRVLDRGWPAWTPAALILDAATPRMWVWRGPLGELGTLAVPAALSSSPGTIVIGEVAALPIELVNGALATPASLLEGTRHACA